MEDCLFISLMKIILVSAAFEGYHEGVLDMFMHSVSLDRTVMIVNTGVLKQ